MGADLGQYILQTLIKKNMKIQWEGEFESPSGYAGVLTQSYGKSGQPAEVNVWSTRQ